MGTASMFCQLGRCLSQWEREVSAVRSVTVSDEAGVGDDGSITAEVELVVEMGMDDAETVGCNPAITRDGTLELDLGTTLGLPDTDEYTTDVSPVDARIDPGKGLITTVSLTVTACDARSASAEEPSSREEREPDRETGAQGEESSSERRSVPPFKDPELLQEVYDTHDTFAEMAEALDMHVTGETVRRYMIDHDIHKPNSYGTESTMTAGTAVEGDNSEMVVISDGIGLPEDVDVEALIDTVNRSSTIYEVMEDLGLERTEAHDLLKELNLMDLVMGRLSNDANRNITREDVIDRLRDVSKARTA